MPRLVFEKSGVPVQSFEFDEPRVTLGRGAENDIVLADLGDKKIHRAEHARIERRQSHWFLVTPPGRNPMLVNGAPGMETRLRHGDEVRLGWLLCSMNPAPSCLSPASAGSLASSRSATRC
jgi:predicted component of type VI protein secretion system